jgi:hypothetical protein
MDLASLSSLMLVKFLENDFQERYEQNMMKNRLKRPPHITRMAQAFCLIFANHSISAT